MIDQTNIGPVLCEERFFALLRSDIPALALAKQAYLDGREKEARHLFAEHVRAITDTEKFYSVRASGADAPLSEKTKRTAENAMHNLLSSCGEPYQFGEQIDWFFNPTFNGYSEWPWQLSRHDEIRALASVYRATREEKYAEKAVWLMLSWIRQALRPDDGTSPYATVCWRTIECGLRLQCWVGVLHAIMTSPALTDEALCLIFRSIYEHCHRLHIDHTKGTNWLVMEMTGLAKTVTTFPVFAESDELLSYALDKLCDTFSSQIHPDGFQYELSTCYHRVVLDQCMVVANLVDTYGKRMSEEFYRTIERMLMVYVRLAQSGFIVPDLNDGDFGHCKGFLKKHTELYPENEVFRYVMSDGKEGRMSLPTAQLLENAGIVTLRDTWEAGGRVSVLFDAGKFGSNHQHEDKLNLCLSAFGRGLLVESNRYAYDNSSIRQYVLASASHNTVLVDGYGQNRKKNYKWTAEQLTSTEDVPVYFSDGIDYAHGVYAEGYGPEAEPLARHERDILFVKTPKVGYPYLVAIDTLTAEQPRNFESVWHFDSASEPEIDEKAVRFDEITAFLSGDVGELCIVNGQTEPVVQGILCNSTVQGDYRGIPTLLHKSKGTYVKTATVFVPTNGEECAVKSVDFDGDLLTVIYKNGETDKFSQSEIASKSK